MNAVVLSVFSWDNKFELLRECSAVYIMYFVEVYEVRVYS